MQVLVCGLSQNFPFHLDVTKNQIIIEVNCKSTQLISHARSSGVSLGWNYVGICSTLLFLTTDSLLTLKQSLKFMFLFIFCQSTKTSKNYSTGDLMMWCIFSKSLSYTCVHIWKHLKACNSHCEWLSEQNCIWSCHTHLR